jgi:hypothetical protein
MRSLAILLLVALALLAAAGISAYADHGPANLWEHLNRECYE